jgi:hypothetical protein
MHPNEISVYKFEFHDKMSGKSGAGNEPLLNGSATRRRFVLPTIPMCLHVNIFATTCRTIQHRSMVLLS